MIFPESVGAFERRFVAAAQTESANAGAPGDSRPQPDDLQVDLGPGLQVTHFSPGRFANAVQKNLSFTHARQVIRDETTSSFVLNLEPDGSATLCRGWRYLSFNDGPEAHTSEHIREQLGYRGRWESRGTWVHVDVKLDDSICPRIGNYSNLVPRHSADWHLRCLPIMPKGHPLLTTPALACRSSNVGTVFGEDEPHSVDGILPNRWLVLGVRNGLRIKVVSSGFGGQGVPVTSLEYSAEPVLTNAWESSF
jgi:hypothetical protein